MRIVTKEEMAKLPAGTVFADVDEGTYSPYRVEIEVKESETFGATSLIPGDDGEPYTWDWSLDEYKDTDKFFVFEKDDINQMIDLLQSALEKY